MNEKDIRYHKTNHLNYYIIYCYIQNIYLKKIWFEINFLSIHFEKKLVNETDQTDSVNITKYKYYYINIMISKKINKTTNLNLILFYLFFIFNWSLKF